MTLKQAYIKVFYYLEPYYFNTKDDLMGMLLGSMNPFFFVDDKPDNPNYYLTGSLATWEDWMRAVRKTTEGYTLEGDQTFAIMIDFLKIKKNEFGFAPGWIIDELEKRLVNQVIGLNF